MCCARGGGPGLESELQRAGEHPDGSGLGITGIECVLSPERGNGLLARLRGGQPVRRSHRRATTRLMPVVEKPSERPTRIDGEVPSLAELARDRKRLVEVCIKASDAVTSPGLRKELLDALAASGVVVVEIPAHTPFDPNLHKAADRRLTEHQELEGLVAETERPGFSDHGHRLRWPEVVVYQTDSWRSPQ